MAHKRSTDRRKRVKFDPDRIIGERWGKLTVVRFDHDEFRHYPTRPNVTIRIHYVLFHCDCGKDVVLSYNSVATNCYSAVRSCGCLYYDKMKESRRYPDSVRSSSLLAVYNGMYDRCNNPKSKDYPNYGGRGIYICDEWMKPDRIAGYTKFYEWAFSEGYIEFDPSRGHKNTISIDRIDNDGPYAPWNCRWVTVRDQANNRRSSKHIVDLDGEVLTYAQFDRKHNLPYRTTKMRMHEYRGKHWPLDAILFAAYHPELGIHKTVGINSTFVDKDGFHVLIPSISWQQKIYNMKKGSNK